MGEPEPRRATTLLFLHEQTSDAGLEVEERADNSSRWIKGKPSSVGVVDKRLPSCKISAGETAKTLAATSTDKATPATRRSTMMSPGSGCPSAKDASSGRWMFLESYVPGFRERGSNAH